MGPDPFEIDDHYPIGFIKMHARPENSATEHHDAHEAGFDVRRGIRVEVGAW